MELVKLMKLSKTLISGIIFVIILSNFILTEDPTEFDYIKGDYSTIDDWSEVDWGKIPAHRIVEVPADKLDYSKLYALQRLELSVEQIEHNLENIENLAKDVNGLKAKEAIKKKYGVLIDDFGQSAKIENGVLKATFGEEGRLDFSGKGETWKVEIDKDGTVRVLEPKEIGETGISILDSFTLVEETTFVAKSGSITTVKDLSFENGLAYVKEETTARVGDYVLSGEENRVTIYFDSEIQQEGNYVVLTDDALRIGTTTDGTVKIVPQPGNDLFNMVKMDHSTDSLTPMLVPDENDFLSITVSKGDGLEVSSREDLGKTPEIMHNSNGGEIKIETGRMSFRIEDDNLKVVPPKAFSGTSGPIDMSNSVAFELISDSEKIQDTLRTSSSNRFVLLRDGKEVAGNNLGLEVSDSIELNMMKNIGDLRAKYPGVDFNFEVNEVVERAYGDPGSGLPSNYKDITAHMAQYVDQLLSENSDIENNVEKISFNTVASIGAGFGEIMIGERTIDAPNSLTQPTRDFDSPLDYLTEGTVVWPKFSEALGHQLPKIGDISFEQLKTLQEGEDYNIETREGPTGVLVIAPHAGVIEPGSAMLAEDIAGKSHDLYTFRAYKQYCNDEGCRSLHVTSTKFKEPRLMEMAGSADMAVSIHAYGSRAKEEKGEEIPKVIVGGGNKEMRDNVADNLRARGFNVEVREKGQRFSGTSDRNLVNQPPQKGVQIEVSRALMRELYIIESDESVVVPQISDGVAPLPVPVVYPTQKQKLFVDSVRQGISDYNQLQTEGLVVGLEE
jgi:phage replication-related protein YjqB (UPF0714/DUF867 family)